jgi:excisionase family DNA binding protein
MEQEMQTEQASLPKLFSVRRVAEQTSTGERTIREWIRRGRLKSVRLGGRVMVPEPNCGVFVRKDWTNQQSCQARIKNWPVNRTRKETHSPSQVSGPKK